MKRGYIWLIVVVAVLLIFLIISNSTSTGTVTGKVPFWKKWFTEAKAIPTPTPEPEVGECGDGSVNAGEVCDGTNLNGKTCQSFGYNEGTLSCCSGCMRFDLSSCRNVSRRCKDQDNGTNYYVASNVTFSESYCYGSPCPGPNGEEYPVTCTGGGSILRDTCNSTIILFERICKSDNIPSTVSYTCPYGCLNGACKNQTTTNCTDSDGGLNYYVKGICTDNYGEMNDGCIIGGFNDGWLREINCADRGTGLRCQMNDYNCTYGCLNGACRKNQSA